MTVGGGEQVALQAPDHTLRRVCSLDELRTTGTRTVSAGGYTIAVFEYGDQVYAVDNRCPHMGFPLNQGTVQDGILTCH